MFLLARAETAVVFVEIVFATKVLNVIDDVVRLPVEIVFVDKDTKVVGPAKNVPVESVIVEIPWKIPRPAVKLLLTASVLKDEMTVFAIKS